MENILIYKKQKKSFEFRAPLWYIKYTRYEFWPLWLMYTPAIFYWLYLALRSRSATYFTAANPGIEMGGFCGESKIDILKLVPKEYLPKTIFIPKKIKAEYVVSLIEQNNITFPIICKPNIGERGYKVEKINSIGELEEYMSTSDFDILIQEYIDYELELGLLYYRYPDNTKYGITSIVKKQFLTITGDGISTIDLLIDRNIRARFQKENLKIKLGDKFTEVLPYGEQIVLEPIGNHCRGTMFINVNHLVNKQLEEVFKCIVDKMSGFYFGRFDLKVKSLKDLYEGKNIKIMEVNGTTSEPAHIYDPNYKLLNAYKDIFYNMKLVQQISILNNKNGIPYTPFKTFWKTVKNHLYP